MYERSMACIICNGKKSQTQKNDELTQEKNIS